MMTTTQSTLSFIEMLNELDNLLARIPYATPRMLIEPDHHNNVKKFLELWMGINCFSTLEPDLYNAIKNIKERKHKDMIVTEDWNSILDAMKQIANLLTKYSKWLGIEEDEEKMMARNEYIRLLNKLEYVSDRTTISSTQYNYRKMALSYLRRLIAKIPFWWIKMESISLNRQRLIDSKSYKDITIHLLSLEPYLRSHVVGFETAIPTPTGYICISAQPRFWYYDLLIPAMCSIRYLDKNLNFVKDTYSFIAKPVHAETVCYERHKDYYYVGDKIITLGQGCVVWLDQEGNIVKLFRPGIVYYEYGTTKRTLKCSPYAIARVSEDEFTIFTLTYVGYWADDPRIFIFRINSNGDILDIDEQGRPHGWRIWFDWEDAHHSHAPHRAVALDSDHILLAASTADLQPLILCTERNGKPYWAYYTPTFSGARATITIKLNDDVAIVVWACGILNSLIAYVTSSGVGQIFQVPFAILGGRMMPDGDIIFLGCESYQIPNPPGIGITNGRVIFLKMSPSGEIRWAFSIEQFYPIPEDQFMGLSDVVEEEDYYVFFSGALVGYIPFYATVLPCIIRANKKDLEELYKHPEKDVEVISCDERIFLIRPRTISLNPVTAEWIPLRWSFSVEAEGATNVIEEIDEMYIKDELYCGVSPPIWPMSWLDILTAERPISLDIIRPIRNNGGYYIAGRTFSGDRSKSDLLLIELDNTINVKRAVRITGLGSINPKDIVMLPDGDVLVSCEIDKFGDAERSALIIRLDSNFNYKHALALSFENNRTEPASILITSEGKILLFGNTDAVRYPYWSAFMVELNDLIMPKSLPATCTPYTTEATIIYRGQNFKIIRTVGHNIIYALSEIRPNVCDFGYFDLSLSYFNYAYTDVYVEPCAYMSLSPVYPGNYYAILIPSLGYTYTNILFIRHEPDFRAGVRRITGDVSILMLTSSPTEEVYEPNPYEIYLGHARFPDNTVKAIIFKAKRQPYITWARLLTKFSESTITQSIEHVEEGVVKGVICIGSITSTGYGLIGFIGKIPLPARTNTLDQISIQYVGGWVAFGRGTLGKTKKSMIFAYVPLIQ